MSNYLKLFETTNEYTQYIEQGSPLLPNVSYTEDALKVYYNPIPHDYSKDYFTIVVIEGGHIGFDNSKSGSLSISKDKGETWEEVETSDGIDVSEGDTISVKCVMNNFFDEGYDFISSSESFKAKIQGNIMSLLVSDNFMDATVLENNYLSSLFKNSEWLIDAQNLVLPATTLVEGCYENMFVNCSNLVYAPKVLPATTLVESCYSDMFQGCTSLVTAPVLPATTLAEHCYSGMFVNCSSLVNAPVLPATTLAESCYTAMFKGCTSLVTAPVLPATTLEIACYSNMFEGCTSLVTAPVLPATTLVYTCYTAMFKGCTSLVTAPVLPATTLEIACYSAMFDGCTSLNYVKAMFTTDIRQNGSYTGGWLNNVSATGTFVGNAEASWLDDFTRTNSTVPQGWTIEKE